MPQILSELLQEAGKEDFSADKLARIILKDPSLTGKILRLSNSSFYQRMTEISTVHQAVSVLGVTTVKCFALSSSVFHADRISAESGVDSRKFFVFVMSVAAAAEQVAKTINFPVPEEALIAGLLHDIGVMYFLHTHPREYRKVLERQSQGRSLVDAELEVFGIDHCEVGWHLAVAWHLPQSVCEAIAHHHNMQTAFEGDQLGNIVRLSVLLTLDRFADCEHRLEERLKRISAVSELLGMTREKVNEVTENLLTRTVNMAENIGVDIGDHEELLSRANQEIWKSFLTIEHLFKERQELSKKLLIEEREKGAVAAKNVALATLSHYLNNAVMAVYGRSQIMRIQQRRGQNEKLIEQIPKSLQVIDGAVKKIVAVLEEMKEISPIDQIEAYNMSKALNIDDRLKARLEQMSDDPSQVFEPQKT